MSKAHATGDRKKTLPVIDNPDLFCLNLFETFAKFPKIP